MTDSEVIQWWAEKVGWEDHKDFWMFRPGKEQSVRYMWPVEVRCDLYALAGLAEDWLRERLLPMDLVATQSNKGIAVRMAHQSVTEIEVLNDDPTIAKLLAFRSLAEKLDEEPRL